MLNEWQTVELGSLCEIFDGPHATPRKTSTGPVFLGVSSLSRGRLSLAESEHLSEEDYVKWTRRVTPRAGDVVFSYETRIGEAAIIPNDLRCCLGRRMGLLRVKTDEVDPRFLLYAYVAPEFQETLRARTIHGSTVDRIPLTELPKFLISIPSLAEQRAIAKVLGTLDDKIELNRRMNETLESMAQALFKSWFIDFDPVHAKPAGKDRLGIRSNASIFPDRFKNSELGDIPRGWSVRSVYDCATFINGVVFSKVHFSTDDSGLPIVKIAELKDGITAQTKFTNDELAGKYKIRDVEILFSWSGSPDTSIDTFVWAGGGAWLNQHIFKVEFDAPREKLFVYYLLKHLKPTFIEIARDKQTTGLGHVTAQDLKRLKVAFPPTAILEAFNGIVEPIFKRSFETLTESRTLAGLRDALLPKLLSGKIRLKNVDSLPMIQ